MNFYCLEGVDGSGKTTLLNMLSSYPFMKTGCEPTYEGYGALARTVLSNSNYQKISFKELLTYFLKDREENQQWINQSLKEGYSVFLDRYILSTMAYQGLHFSLEELFKLNKHFLKPEIIFFLYAPFQITLKRKNEECRDLYETPKLQRRVYQNYLDSIDILQSRGYRIIFLDALLDSKILIKSIIEKINLKKR